MTTQTIAELNDKFRQGDMSLGIVVMTPKVRALTLVKQAELMELVKGCLWFGTECNEPNSERNFGGVTLGKGYYWQIDYYDLSLTQASVDPTNPGVTKRVMTLMQEEEY